MCRTLVLDAENPKTLSSESLEEGRGRLNRLVPEPVSTSRCGFSDAIATLWIRSSS